MSNKYTVEDLIEFIETGREIEFTYNNNRFSITYYSEGSENEISFTQFYKEPKDYKNVEDFLKKGSWQGELIINIWMEATNVDIF
ncbi:MAG: hypothetical protein LBV67_00080 [Streptococcaceae bacterium]|jgi:hypothetical protein|nr:hypothetical protein [Streptococcaceae bacterium]